MIPLDPGLVDYISRHSTPEDKILADLNRQTYLDMLNPQMLAGHLHGDRCLHRVFSHLPGKGLAG